MVGIEDSFVMIIGISEQGNYEMNQSNFKI